MKFSGGCMPRGLTIGTLRKFLPTGYHPPTMRSVILLLGVFLHTALQPVGVLLVIPVEYLRPIDVPIGSRLRFGRRAENPIYTLVSALKSPKRIRTANQAHRRRNTTSLK